MFEQVIDYISRTNLFNFIIFAGIIIYLFIKLDVIGGLEKAKDDVAHSIEASEATKETSEENLHTVEDRVAGLAEEIDKIIEQSECNAKLVGEKIICDANKSAESINENAEKLIENKTALMRNDILKRASDASVEVAKNHIINELNNNYELHEKLINESIEAINGVDL